MLLPTSLVIIGVAFPLVAVSAPINCPPGAPCIPDPWRKYPSAVERSSDIDHEVVKRGKPFTEPVPGPTFPDLPMHPNEEKRQTPTKHWPYYGYPGPIKIERSASPESSLLDTASQPEKRQKFEPPTWPHRPPPPSSAKSVERSVDSEVDQPEKRQTTTGTWPYYGYPVKEPKGPVKIERSASPEPVQLGPHGPEIPHPHYVYSEKRSAEPEAESSEDGPWNSYPPSSGNLEPAPEKREASPYKLPDAPDTTTGGRPRYLYQDSEKRAAETDEEAPESTSTAMAAAMATPYYEYRVPEKREDQAEPTVTAKSYYGYRVSDKRNDAPQSMTTTTPYYGYRVPESDA